MGFYITVEPSVKIFVEELGPKNGKPILFVHGWPLNRKMFEYQFDQIPNAGYRCIRMDLRGFGSSDKPWTGYSYDRMADDIRIVIDTLKLKNLILVGYSMGGAIVIRHMVRHAGQNISKLVLMGAAAPVFTKRPGYPYGMTKEQVNKLIQATYTDRPKMLEEFGDLVFEQPISDSFKSWFHGLGLEASGHATAMTAMSLRDEELWNDMHKIHVPTGIFHGVKDKICPFEFAQVQHAQINGSKLFSFNKSGHGIFYCELEKFNREFLRFVSG
ncbi:alpha/beta fold hydrolase [Alkalihalobacillus sp. AL-G]|uniref:alpha/beta fold hydrolase n=1 Tax=Alkalihalobacillus sp. AL-G TaxID=2926399 RepID=UPI00272A698F|nr:alpha/beta hydrolase [Alkalihalobacillus sp. AL-G]WLD94030.1 alpha/beta hydrolase [Alkalihalobacillus sp. AL-G]